MILVRKGNMQLFVGFNKTEPYLTEVKKEIIIFKKIWDRKLNLFNSIPLFLHVSFGQQDNSTDKGIPTYSTNQVNNLLKIIAHFKNGQRTWTDISLKYTNSWKAQEEMFNTISH